MMTKPAITVTAALSIENCLRLMRVAGARRLLVVEGTKLLGIITSTDIFDRIISDKA
jgi:predicted transcriptional regulator